MSVGVGVQVRTDRPGRGRGGVTNIALGGKVGGHRDISLGRRVYAEDVGDILGVVVPTTTKPAVAVAVGRGGGEKVGEKRVGGEVTDEGEKVGKTPAAVHVGVGVGVAAGGVGVGTGEGVEV